MQTIGTQHSVPIPSSSSSRVSASVPDLIRDSITDLLSYAHTSTCSAASKTFTQIVQPVSRFQVALDTLLPVLDSSSAELAQRILVSYILYSLYATHPIEMNPFKPTLNATFLKAKELTIHGDAQDGTGTQQLVWVLWKILRGEGDELSTRSPDDLARSPLPLHFCGSTLILSDGEHTQHTFSDTLTKSALSASSSRELELEKDSDNIQRKQAAAHAMRLLLSARERVLTLSEQRILTPMIPNLLSTPGPMIASLDLQPLICNNPSIAYNVLIAILSVPRTSLAVYVDVLQSLPPILPSFDIMSRLLTESTVIDPRPSGSTDNTSLSTKITVADLVRTEVLGRFVHECIRWLDNAENEEEEGLINDDRVAKGAQNLCRFYTSLIKRGIVDVASEMDSVEMAHFSLKHARFEEANVLYRLLATGLSNA